MQRMAHHGASAAFRSAVRAIASSNRLVPHGARTFSTPRATVGLRWSIPRPTHSTRPVVSTASTNPPKDETMVEPASEPEEIVLFHNPVNTSERLMRSGLAFSTLHTLYWIWYTTDFIPIVNQAALQALHISPVVGYAGIAFAACIQGAFVWYPYRLVSKLSYQPQHDKILVYTHRIPLMRPNLLPSASFPVGPSRSATTTTTSSMDLPSAPTSGAPTQFFKLDSSSPYAIHIVNELQGDLTQYRGYLTVGPPLSLTSRYTLNIQSTRHVPEPELLLDALLRPEQLGRDTRKAHSFRTSRSLAAPRYATRKKKVGPKQRLR